jgi:hypothetical protein
MKKIETFEDAKQAVAEKHGFESWHILIGRLVKTASVIELSEAITEAAELYSESRSRKAANEAVKAESYKPLSDIYLDDESCRKVFYFFAYEGDEFDGVINKDSDKEFHFLGKTQQNECGQEKILIILSYYGTPTWIVGGELEGTKNPFEFVQFMHELGYHPES